MSTRWQRVLVLGALVAPTAVVAQPGVLPFVSEDPPPTAGDPDPTADCLAHYRVGSVEFDVGTPPHAAAPGDLLRVQGSVRNTNAYPIPEGRVLARVLRQDPRVASAHWHPIVDEEELTGTFDLPANGSQPLVFAWQVPAYAPAGLYRAEFFFLSGRGTVFSGIPTIPSIAGGSALFSVRDAGLPAALTFDRASVRLNGKPIALRSTPPALSPGEPVTVDAVLRGEGSFPIAARLHTAFYAWSNTDRSPPILEQTSEVAVRPGEHLAAPFRWDAPRPGTYELVLTATPQDAHVLPSVLKVRFAVTGNAPRVTFAGIGAYTANGDATVTTCAVNELRDAGTWSLTTQVTADGRPVGNFQSPATAESAATTRVQIPRSALRKALVIRAEARDDRGEIVDQTTLTYPAAALRGERASATGGPPAALTATASRRLILFAALALLGIGVLGALFWTMRQRRRTP